MITSEIKILKTEYNGVFYSQNGETFFIEVTEKMLKSNNDSFAEMIGYEADYYAHYEIGEGWLTAKEYPSIEIYDLNEDCLQILINEYPENVDIQEFELV